jgi:hypothetical protein
MASAQPKLLAARVASTAIDPGLRTKDTLRFAASWRTSCNIIGTRLLRRPTRHDVPKALLRIDRGAFRSSVIYRLMHPFLARTARAAIKGAACLNAVPDDAATTMLTHRRQAMNRALEAVEDMRLARRRGYLEGEMILISTNFALTHVSPPM